MKSIFAAARQCGKTELMTKFIKAKYMKNRILTEKPYCIYTGNIDRDDYEAHLIIKEIFPDINALKEKYKDLAPTKIFDYPNRAVYAKFTDQESEFLDIEAMLALGVIKETVFNEVVLKEYARVLKEQNDRSRVMAKGFVPLSSFVVRDDTRTEEEIIRDHKELNKYSWVVVERSET